MKLKGSVAVILVAAMMLFTAASSYCADKAEARKEPAASSKVPQSPMQMNVMRNFGVVAGSVTKVDTADPANSYIEVKSDIDGTVQKLAVMPWTSIVKISELSDIKPGETVRVMAQRSPEKATAISITFGKFKAPPIPPVVSSNQGPMKPLNAKDTPKQ